jgi:hypothetical protein
MNRHGGTGLNDCLIWMIAEMREDRSKGERRAIDSYSVRGTKRNPSVKKSRTRIGIGRE